MASIWASTDSKLTFILSDLTSCHFISNMSDPHSVFKSVKLSRVVNDFNKDRAVVLKGLPYHVDADQIAEKFSTANVKVRYHDIHFESMRGKRTGAVAVIMNSSDDVH